MTTTQPAPEEPSDRPPLSAAAREAVEWMLDAFKPGGLFSLDILRSILAAEPSTPGPEGDDTGHDDSEPQEPSQSVDLDAIEEEWARWCWAHADSETRTGTDSLAGGDIPVLIAEVRRLRAELEATENLRAGAQNGRDAAQAACQRLQAELQTTEHDRVSACNELTETVAEVDRLRRELAEQPGRIAAKIADLAPYNCELRPDGSEDALMAAWVDAIGQAHVVALSFTPAAEPDEDDLPGWDYAPSMVARFEAVHTSRPSREDIEKAKTAGCVRGDGMKLKRFPLADGGWLVHIRRSNGELLQSRSTPKMT